MEKPVRPVPFPNSYSPVPVGFIPEDEKLGKVLRQSLEANVAEAERRNAIPQQAENKELLEDSSEKKSTEHWFDHGIWANPLFLGALVMLAFALSFSPKTNTFATWFCLFVAWLLVARLIYTRV